MGDDVLQASGDACGLCLALDGTDAERPHELCQCQVVPKHADDCPYEWLGGAVERYGPGEADAVLGAEVWVTCGGTVLGTSTTVDLGAYPGEPVDMFDYIEDQLQLVANDLCAGCPPSEDPLVA